jgi:hypothetical protein
MSCHVCLFSPGLDLVHVQPSALNRYWYVLRFVPWDSVHFLSVRNVSNCKQLQCLVAFYIHVACNTQLNCLIYNLQHCGILQVTYCSFNLNPPLLLYDLLHTPLCVSWCVFRWLWRPRDITSELNDRSPRCVRRCLFRLLWSLNDLLHMSQQNGRFPLCMSWCLFRLFCWLNDLLHMSQQNGCSPVCMCWCVFRWLWSLNDLLHTLQQNGRSPLCMRSCVFR